MAYQFSLATVLRVRLIREEREERMLMEILRNISQTMVTIAQIERGITQLQSSKTKSLSNAVSGHDLQALYADVDALKQNKRELEEQLEQLEQLRDKQIAVYRSARREREMLTSMHQHQRAEYAVELLRREQAMLDDLYGSRRRQITA